MSQQVGGLLETRNSYPFDRNKVSTYKNNTISPDKFFAWHGEYMYKSTYNEKHGLVIPSLIQNLNEPKNTAIPGYQGFVPSIKADSLYGKSNTQLARGTLTSDKLDVNRTGLATTGFNITKDAFIDQSKLASSSKYGKTAIQKSHPHWNVSHVIYLVIMEDNKPNKLHESS